VARTLTTEEISKLTVADRLDLIATLWDSIDPRELPLPESHRQALDRELEDYNRNPGAGQTWDTIRDELFPKK
jgi:putative addiction module component (TIGR02574 family)